MDMPLFSVDLRKIINKQRLQIVTCEEVVDSIKITNMDVNRPGLPLTGFFDYFDASRIQVFGKMESTYLEKLSPEEEFEKIDRLFSAGIPALVITRSLQPSEQMIRSSIERKIPILRTEESTSRFMSALIAMLNVELGERITRHGVLVEVYGEGILILGESGVGKSETAIELVKRGHRLVADDAVEIKKVSEITLVGSAPDIIKHFIELRGIGIVDVKNIFGMGAVKDTEKIDMVINLEQWQQHKKYDRLGLDNETIEILGINLPALTIPVRPGRNLAIIIEVAAMNNRQKRMGYNAAEELNKRLTDDMERRQNESLN
ncbi:MAG: HPr(Ser) kinase/phosphatase [Clostridia bacterium]|nr:HPr(Ser) kinase/phosphatase [Clostridia bacterium]